MKVLIDTNVLISAALNAHGTPLSCLFQGYDLSQRGADLRAER